MNAKRAGPRRVTIKDVATSAGVSPATVSFVLNKTPGQTIPETTAERVRSAATSLGYVPHGVARTLREGRSRVVLLNRGTLTGGNSLDSFIDGMRSELAEHDHALLVLSGTGQVSREVLEVVAPRHVVDLTRLTAGEDGTVVGMTEGLTAGLSFHTLTQLRYLAEHGHTRIAIAIPADTNPLVTARLAHAGGAAQLLGLPPPRPVTIDTGESPEARRKAVGELIAGGWATAVAAYSDDVALAVLAAMAHFGLRAPGDLAVIGFDEGPHGRLWSPALTTVRIDAARYGRRAARVALGLEPGAWERTPSRVIERESA